MSDIHAGCRMALCPTSGATLDDGGTYQPSPLQKKLWAWWEEFWGEWVPTATKKEPFCVVVNGDVVDGVHHRATTQISQNVEDQAEIAYQLLWPITQACEGRIYITRGTEAHVGSSAVQEESIGKRLGAKKNKHGQHTSYVWRIRIGDALAEFTHHIATASSMAYEGSAPTREMQYTLADRARWREEVPDFFVWSHRHSHIEVRFPSANHYLIGFVTAAWQLRTPFSYRIAGGRTNLPQIGGHLIRQGDREAFSEHFVKHLTPPAIEIP